MSQEYITFTIGQKKNIALIAHDNEKQKLIAWCKEHKTKLEKHNLYGTGTTSCMITDQTGLTVKGYNSGPLGGDQQIGAKIVEGVIDFVIFFSDPLTAQPHDPDVTALMRRIPPAPCSFPDRPDILFRPSGSESRQREFLSPQKNSCPYLPWNSR